MWLTIVLRYVWSDPGIRASVGISLALLAWDVAISGSILVSWICCPIWMLGSIVKNTIQRPGWRFALFRIAFPALTLGLVLGNNVVQHGIAQTNAARIIAATEEFHAANDRYPCALDELVPQYMASVPRAKYCLVWGDFLHFNLGKPMLVWYVVPPYGRKIYDFEGRRWSYLD